MLFLHKVTNERYRGTLEKVPITTPVATYSLWYVRLTQVNGIKSDFREYGKAFYSTYKELT